MGEPHLPFWTAGSGHYGNTLGPKQEKVASTGTDLILSFLDSVPVHKDRVFTIGDYGVNDGYSSMPLIHSVIDHLRRKHGDDLPIRIIYEDQEKNDFNSLFNRLNGSSSYLSKFPNVYTLATNTNFYKQCVPDNSCDVIFTSYAVHWLEKLDMNFKDCVFDIFATKEEHQRFCVEAERDWTKFLALRAKELKPGGIVVAIQWGSRPSRQIVQGEVSTRGSGMETDEIDILLDMENAWKQLKEDKRITQEEFEKCTVRAACRSSAQLKSPFERQGSAVQQAGLRLEHCDVITVPCLYKSMWREHKEKDAEKGRAFYADLLTNATEVWTRTEFYNSLSDTRTEEGKTAIVEELFQRYRTMVKSKDPETYKSEDTISRVVAKKL